MSLGANLPRFRTKIARWQPVFESVHLRRHRRSWTLPAHLVDSCTLSARGAEKTFATATSGHVQSVRAICETEACDLRGEMNNVP